MLCPGSRPLAIKLCQVGTAGSVRIIALKKRTKKRVCSLIHESLQKFTVQSFMLSSRCLLKPGHVAPENPTYSHLSRVDICPEIWLVLVKVGSCRRQFQKEKIKISIAPSPHLYLRGQILSLSCMLIQPYRAKKMLIMD